MTQRLPPRQFLALREELSSGLKPREIAHYHYNCILLISKSQIVLIVISNFLFHSNYCFNIFVNNNFVKISEISWFGYLFSYVVFVSDDKSAPAFWERKGKFAVIVK